MIRWIYVAVAELHIVRDLVVEKLRPLTPSTEEICASLASVGYLSPMIWTGEIDKAKLQILPGGLTTEPVI